MVKKAVILVSGGVDSSTVLAMALEQGYEVYALSVNYSQRNKPELDKVKILLRDFPIKSHKIVVSELF